jgi:hypothetical protein
VDSQGRLDHIRISIASCFYTRLYEGFPSLTVIRVRMFTSQPLSSFVQGLCPNVRNSRQCTETCSYGRVGRDNTFVDVVMPISRRTLCLKIRACTSFPSVQTLLGHVLACSRISNRSSSSHISCDSPALL